MKTTKSLVVRLEGRSFVLEVDNSEEDLISEMMSALGSFIRKGVPIKVVQTSAPSMGKSQSMWTKILTNLKELGDWVETLKKLGRVHRSRP
jgi:membrane protease subunit (stomatin/prohibitin family)